MKGGREAATLPASPFHKITILKHALLNLTDQRIAFRTNKYITNPPGDTAKKHFNKELGTPDQTSIL